MKLLGVAEKALFDIDFSGEGVKSRDDLDELDLIVTVGGDFEY